MSFFKRASGAGRAEPLGEAADKMLTAVMTVDRDLVVNCANTAAIDLLRRHVDALRAKWPSLDAQKIVGTRLDIDGFCSDPAAFHRALSDPKQLPLVTELVIGDRKVELNVNGAFDRSGNHCGSILEWRDVTDARRNEGLLNALNRIQAVIEFSLDGVILRANDNFLKMFGYTIEEIEGQHHSMFLNDADRQDLDHRKFWEKFSRGEYDAGGYKLVGKGGVEVWIRASFNPVFDTAGKPYKVVGFATDITENRRATANFQGQLAAIGKAQAVVEYSLDGKVLIANENFCTLFGYEAAEIQGHHHSMFVAAADRQTAEYRTSWDRLGRGEYEAGQYRRVGKDGKEIWIASSYNPILDTNNKPFKVVEFATDVTAQVRARQALQRAAQQVIAAVKENDLTQRIPLDGMTGDIAALCAGVNGLVDAMTGVISKIKATSREVSNASAEISTSTTDLSQRTEQQAASLEETSASMEEISVTVKKNAENAQEANNFATGTREVADRGGKVVADAVHAMSRIEKSSRKISDIIGVIDEIARQTNLLALNAAIEAARAGDAGRGFAVVASEVRNLAQRSSQAAKDIKDLITNSNAQVKNGVELVNRAGTALGDIVESIGKVADIVSGIANASMEQSTGLEQVSRALVQMDEVTQQNSALVEENAATAKTLERQVQAMNEQVSDFRLIGDQSVQRSPAQTSVLRHAAAARSDARPPRRATAGRLQGNLAIAAEEDPEWKEF